MSNDVSKLKGRARSLANLRPVKKGEPSRNPKGRQIENPEMKKIKNLTREELVEVGSLVLKGSVDELRAIAKDGKATALKCMVAAVAVRTISKGDPQALDALLNRLIGKVKEHIEVDGLNLGTQQVVIMLPPKQEQIKDVQPVQVELPVTKDTDGSP